MLRTLALALLIVAAGETQAAGPGARLAAPPSCPKPIWSTDGNQLDGRFGTVAPAGDVNGDGFADVLIGAYNYDDPEVDEGVVFLYLGSALGLAATPAWSMGADQAWARNADKLSTAGDVNGDGFDDVITGAGLFDAGEEDEGRAFVFLGSASGLQATPDWHADGEQVGANFGACVQAAGDVNGDGYDDVIVGAWLYDRGETNEGAAFIYLGSDSGLADIPAWVGESNSAGAVYGYFCTRAGDLNGDGYEDIVAGARRFSDNGLSREGRAYVYYGSANGPSTTADWTKDGGQAGGEFGTSPAPAGDVNGDGYDDLLVNAPRYANPDRWAGKVWLYLGSASGLGDTPAWSAAATQDSAQFGYHVDGAGDVNDDGYDDVVITAPGFDADGIDHSGAVFLYLGSPSGLGSEPAWIQGGDQVRGELGHAGRMVGDVNADGYDDVATGAIYRDSPLESSGRAYLIYGCRELVTDAPAPEASAPRLIATGPNPFVNSTRVTFSVPGPQHVRLTLHDITGRRVATLVDGTVGAGRHEVEWRGEGEDRAQVPPGLYLARFATATETRALKLMRLLR